MNICLEPEQIVTSGCIPRDYLLEYIRRSRLSGQSMKSGHLRKSEKSSGKAMRVYVHRIRHIAHTMYISMPVYPRMASIVSYG